MQAYVTAAFRQRCKQGMGGGGGEAGRKQSASAADQKGESAAKTSGAHAMHPVLCMCGHCKLQQMERAYGTSLKRLL
eukprot:376764-Pelagomonas_calceolata.AAC.4